MLGNKNKSTGPLKFPFTDVNRLKCQLWEAITLIHTSRLLSLTAHNWQKIKVDFWKLNIFLPQPDQIYRAEGFDVSLSKYCKKKNENFMSMSNLGKFREN